MADRQHSVVEKLALMPPAQRRIILNSLDEREALTLMHDWRVWARPEQLAPSWTWDGWIVCAGRGFGKNRLGSEFIHEEVQAGRIERAGLIARTAADIRDTVVEGESGIMATAKPWFRPQWQPGLRRITWPNGATATTFGAEEPSALRGPSHDFVWGDEVSTWQFPEAWSNAMLGCRLGLARWLATMTPKRTPLVVSLLTSAESGHDAEGKTVAITRGSTYDNLANLAPSYIDRVVRQYEGTTLAGQELHGLIVDDDPDALWKRQMIADHRWKGPMPHMSMTAIAIDPAVTSTSQSDETGIIAGGRFELDGVSHALIVTDRSLVGQPHEWANAVKQAYDVLQLDEVVAETNNGGDMVVSTIRQVLPMAKVTKVVASRGKRTRAEPVSLLYQQGRVHHLGTLSELEDQMCTWVPGRDMKSPDRMDAMVWLITRLLLSDGPRYGVDYGIGGTLRS